MLLCWSALFQHPGGGGNRGDLVDWVSWSFKWQASLLPVHFHIHPLLSYDLNMCNVNSKHCNKFPFYVPFDNFGFIYKALEAKGKVVHMNDTLTPLPLLYLSAFPPFSLAEGQRPSRQPHIVLSVKGQLSLQPPVRTSLGFLLCPREHIEGERERQLEIEG